MIAILVAAALGLAVTLLGTPVAIRAFQTWGWGQRIREDGPHTHMEKMGTPTMGGVVMLVALVIGYLGSVVVTRKITVSGAALVFTAIGFGVVGFLDDHAKIRHRRSLGLTKIQKFLGTAIVSLGFAVLMVATSDDTGVSTHLSFTRMFDGTQDGWFVENTEAGNFSVADGVLRVEGPSGWLRSGRRYGNFAMRIQFRFLTADADSGIFVRAPDGR